MDEKVITSSEKGKLHQQKHFYEISIIYSKQ